jgi:predicted nucleic acid-binding protein
MASLSLSAYDGSAGFLVDTNIWIDCKDSASPWHAWAVDRLQSCSERAPLHINLVIYTELLVPEPAVDALDALLDVYETQRSALSWSCAALAARAFGQYRRRGGPHPSAICRQTPKVGAECVNCAGSDLCGGAQ